MANNLINNRYPSAAEMYLSLMGFHQDAMFMYQSSTNLDREICDSRLINSVVALGKHYAHTAAASPVEWGAVQPFKSEPKDSSVALALFERLASGNMHPEYDMLTVGTSLPIMQDKLWQPILLTESYTDTFGGPVQTRAVGFAIDGDATEQLVRTAFWRTFRTIQMGDPTGDTWERYRAALHLPELPLFEVRQTSQTPSRQWKVVHAS